MGLIEQKILSLGWLGALTFLLVGFLARLTTSGVRHPSRGWPLVAGLALLLAAFLFLMPQWNEIRIADVSNVVEPGNKHNSAGTYFKAWLKALVAGLSGILLDGVGPALTAAAQQAQAGQHPEEAGGGFGTDGGSGGGLDSGGEHGVIDRVPSNRPLTFAIGPTQASTDGEPVGAADGAKDAGV